MAELIKSVREVPQGTSYAYELEEVECDPRIKKSIFKLANDLHETVKRLNDTIEVTIALSDALQAMAAEIGVIAATGERLRQKQ